MIDQASFSQAELRAKFEKALKDTRDDFAKKSVDVILRHLSDTVRDLQEAGGAIGITARAGAHTNAYDMMYTASGSHGGTVDAYGHIRIGDSVRLFAIASRHNEKDVTRLYLSVYSAAEEGGRQIAGNVTSQASIKAYCFDFGEDPEALRKLQEELARSCAQAAVVAENDSSRVFGKGVSEGDSLGKTAVRLKREPAL